MTLFTSRFDRAREESLAYAGEAGETRFWIPAAVAAGGVATAAVWASEEWAAGWGDGWDQGWDAGPAASPGDPPVGDDGGEAWSHHGEYTDASVGGDGDFFYFIDGDSSLTIG
ncbi:hypothetical protein HD597_008653 [Nonomuraea thailandensis]|uniref:Uncharacterized protein n=1 Tax=Nonomuraea thailandensis TaxID=1188745 RepID=A0A9X2GWG1_9ACTN|nr:hypothetical protein [Nonomuraea thailandensis]MCP2361633.1 hypothetical protein [Nonomuraea thailandensis]